LSFGYIMLIWNKIEPRGLNAILTSRNWKSTPPHLFLKTGSHYKARLPSNLWSFCLSLLSAGIKDMSHHTFPKNTLFFCSTGAWTHGLYLEPLHQSFFVIGFFDIGSHKLFS
jgi:hypothetical protein